MAGVLALLLVAALMLAGEPPVPPDPFGLGERLALIDHLREVYGRRLPAGSTLQQAQTAYVEAWAARQRAVAADEEGRADREARLRRRLADRHGVTADAGLSESALCTVLRRLDAARAERDAAVIAALVEADRAALATSDHVAQAEQPRAIAPPLATAPETVAESAAAAAAAQPKVELRRLYFPAAGVSECLLASYGERRLMLVTFGVDTNGAFTGIREGAVAILAGAPTINRAVLLLGHGAGGRISNEPIAGHLAAQRAFYETMGGTVPAARVECLVFAACSGGGPAQMAAMSAGLGYWPTWRVASGDNAFTTGLNVLAALSAVATRPAQPAWRGLFRLRLQGAEIVSFGDVGVDGERTETSFFRIVQNTAGQWATEEQR